MKKHIILALFASSIVCLTGHAQAEEELPVQAADQASLKEANSEHAAHGQAQKAEQEAKKAAKKAEKEAKKAEKAAVKAEKAEGKGGEE